MGKSVLRLMMVMAFLGCFRHASLANDSINYRLFNHIVDIPEKYEKSKKRFIKYLQIEARNDTEMVESIYYWMTYNIIYDPAFYDKSNDIYQFTDSFYSRKGICSEYSRLFVQLCELAGLEVEFLAGFAKTSTFAGTLDSNARHAWNRVKLDGAWHLIDATWGSRSKLKAGKIARREPNPYYLFISPENLIKTHFPMKTEWQMLANPVSEKEFLGQ